MTPLELVNCAIHEAGFVRRILLRRLSGETRQAVATEVVRSLPESQAGFTDISRNRIVRTCKMRCAPVYKGGEYGFSVWLWLIGVLIEAIIRWWLSRHDRNLQSVRAEIVCGLKRNLESDNES